MNKSWWKYLFIFFLAFLFQSTLVNYIAILNWKPDLILIVLVMFSLQFGQAAGTTTGFFTGVFSDLVSTHILGLGALSKSIAGYIPATLSQWFQEKSQFVLTLFITGLVHDTIYFFIDTLGKNFSWYIILFVYIIPNMFYTLIIGTFIYYSIGKWLRDEE